MSNCESVLLFSPPLFRLSVKLLRHQNVRLVGCLMRPSHFMQKLILRFILFRLWWRWIRTEIVYFQVISSVTVISFLFVVFSCREFSPISSWFVALKTVYSIRNYTIILINLLIFFYYLCQYLLYFTEKDGARHIVCT